MLYWLNNGDQCTQVFLAKLKRRKQANYIYSINDAQGNRVAGFTDVAKVLTDFYQDLLGKQREERTPILQDIIDKGSVLTIEQQLMLCAAITNQEIKELIFSIPNEKSPGRFPIKELIFAIGQLLKACNSTNLVVVPKLPHPMNTTDFKPISCCTVIYKVISKLLCERLKQVLPSLINQS